VVAALPVQLTFAGNFMLTCAPAAHRYYYGPSFALMQIIRLGQAKICCSPELFLAYEEMVLEAAANAQAHAIVTYKLRDFCPAMLFGIPVLNPQHTFQHFLITVTRSTEP